MKILQRSKNSPLQFLPSFTFSRFDKQEEEANSGGNNCLEKIQASIPCLFQSNPEKRKLRNLQDFSRALSKLQVTTRNSDWFVALFASVVIGGSNYFGNGIKKY